MRHAVRRFRWFAASFRNEIGRLAAETGIDYRIDDTRLAQAFVRWLRAFEAQRGGAEADLRAFSCFAGGLMLRELIRSAPLTAASVPPDAGPTEPISFWPEGYAYVVYCMGVCSAVLDQEFGAKLEPGASFSDPRHWWSFRENMRDDTALAVGFFQMFCGLQPNWLMPAVFAAGAEDAGPSLGAVQTRALSAGGAVPN